MLQGKITKIHQGDQFCFAPLRGSTRVSGIRAQVNCSRQNPELLKTRRETEMLRRMMLRLTVCLTGVVMLGGSLVLAAEGIIAKVANPSGSACHLKFPAIREETLYWDRPVLKDATDGDIIDFYGPCDYDPLGKESVARQRAQYQYFLRLQRSRD
jgi:hypothetical protein